MFARAAVSEEWRKDIANDRSRLCKFAAKWKEKGKFKIVLKAKNNQRTMHILPPTQKRIFFPVINDYYVDKTALLKY